MQEMSGKGQQDAQEWFMCIIDRLHEGVAQYETITDKPKAKSGKDNTKAINGNDSTNGTDKQCVCFFHKVFYGRYNSQITCDTCHTVSSTEDEFSSISLDFKKQVKRKKKQAAQQHTDLKIAIPTLYDCLKTYTTPEPLSPEQYNCNECNTRRSASKHTRIRKLPAILCVHVKRFGMKQLGTGTFIPEKYEGKLDFPLHLDMAPWTTRPPSYANGVGGSVNGSVNNGGSGADSKDKSSYPKDKFLYDLDCVVVHQGEHAQNGHYFAFCRQDNKWFRYDDEIVSATTTEDVMRQEAYLLFYSLRSLEGV